MHFIGVDIGGTKVSITLGSHQGEVIFTEKISTDSLGDSKRGQEKILKMIEQCLVKAGITINQVKALGLAVPGPMSVKKGMLLHPPNLPTWTDVPIRGFLKEHLKIPVFIQNDADAGALAHLEFASSKGFNHLIYLTMSTGVGGGIIVNGKLVQGETDTVGEVGHFVLDLKGPKCMCGQNGCFEAYCGGKNLALSTQAIIEKKQIKTSILEKADGILKNIDMKCILSAAKEDDPFALDIWGGFVNRLAQGLGILLMTLNPDVIFLGTIAMSAGNFLMEPLLAELPRFCWKEPFQHCRIEPSPLGSNLGQMGALAVAMHGLKNS